MHSRMRQWRHAGHFLPHFAHATRASSSSDMDGLHSSGSLSNEAPQAAPPGPAAQAPLHLHRGPQPVASKVLQPGAPHPASCEQMQPGLRLAAAAAR